MVTSRLAFLISLTMAAPWGLSAPRELLEGLRNAGVDLIQMANSCTINNGLMFFGLSTAQQTVAKGAIIILSVALSALVSLRDNNNK